MDRIRIIGGPELVGRIPISGAKNAALPLMIASLLTDEPLVLDNVPRLADVAQLTKILRNHGAEVTDNDGTLTFSTQKITSTLAPYDLVSVMRASFWVIGPLLARCGEAKVSLPGGCAIGTRPVDLFLSGLEQLGAEIVVEGGYVIAKAPHGLRGARIVFPKVSVGATHTLMMAASLAKGETVLENAAREPEIGNLAACLIKMGAKIEGLGTARLTISGVDRLHGTQHAVLPDRIETGTYAFAVAMTGGDVVLENTSRALLEEPLNTLINAGADVTNEKNGIRIRRARGTAIEAVDIATAPFPGFPTDLQAQFMALMTRAKGSSKITETIFENRFMHVAELARFGAQIAVEGDHAVVTGVVKLYGAPVMATDLRASVSLAIAGLAAEGETIISRIYHLDRGFERLEEKLKACGANIERVKE
jgi:UDP-N-acetylglucosamine 1-carboxyvinyltransferase